MTNQNTFGKNERLSGRNQVETLFGAGKSFNMNPFKVLFSFEENAKTLEVKILVAVSKKKFKHAVDRNRVKRKIREAYRLNKTFLLNNLVIQSSTLNIGFVYVGSEKDPAFDALQKAMVTSLEKVARLVNSSLKPDRV